MMGAELLLSRLERVRKRGPGRWTASAPTRDDKHPSVAIRELPDGRVLVHDFGGDSVEDILAAVGLGFDALFPEKLLGGHAVKRERRAFYASDALLCLGFEAVFLGVVANHLAANRPLDEEDRQRVWQSATLIARAQELCSG